MCLEEVSKPSSVHQRGGKERQKERRQESEQRRHSGGLVSLLTPKPHTLPTKLRKIDFEVRSLQNCREIFKNLMYH